MRRTDPGDPDVCNIFTLHKFFSSAETQAAVRVGCTTAGIGCIDCKKMLLEGVKADLARIAARAEELRAQPGRVDEILAAGGGGRARSRARPWRACASAWAWPLGASRAQRRRAGHVCAALAVLAARLAGGACSTRDEGSTPESAVSCCWRRCAPAIGAVFERFGPRTRAHIEELLAGAHKTGGTRMLRPQDLVTVGWVPPAWEAAGTRLIRRDGDEAEVEVYSAAGDRQTVRVVREDNAWKVELPLRSDAAAGRGADLGLLPLLALTVVCSMISRSSSTSSMMTSSSSAARKASALGRRGAVAGRAAGRAARRPGVRAGRCGGRGRRRGGRRRADRA